jgi:hypothetical protein
MKFTEENFQLGKCSKDSEFQNFEVRVFLARMFYILESTSRSYDMHQKYIFHTYTIYVDEFNAICILILTYFLKLNSLEFYNYYRIVDFV